MYFVIPVLAVLLFAAATAPAAAAGVDIARTAPLSVFSGGEFEVSLSIADLDAGGIVETIPEGFTYVSTTHPADETLVSGQHVIFSVIGETAIAYRVRAPAHGSGTFAGVWDNVADGTNGTIPATSVGVSSSDGGGGGGGGSAVTTTAAASAANGTTAARTNRTFSFEREDVTAIAIAANASVEGANISVAALDGPGSLPAAPGMVYRYLDLNLTGVADADLTGATIAFQVNRTWIAAQNISAGSIALARYHDGWGLLPTAPVGSDAGSLTFEADVPGFSVFAIVGEEMAAGPTATTTSTPVTIAAPQVAAAAEKETGSSDGGDALPILGAIVVLIAIAGIGAWYAHARKKDGDEK